MTAIYFCHAGNIMAESGEDGSMKAFSIWSSPLRDRVIIKRPAHHSGKPAVSAINSIINSFFSSIPHPSCHVEPEIYSEGQCGFPAYKIRKEDLVDLGVRCPSIKSSTPQPKRRTEWLKKAGLERPRKTLNLARDAIETAAYIPTLSPAAALS